MTVHFPSRSAHCVSSTFLLPHLCPPSHSSTLLNMIHALNFTPTLRQWDVIVNSVCSLFDSSETVDEESKSDPSQHICRNHIQAFLHDYLKAQGSMCFIVKYRDVPRPLINDLYDSEHQAYIVLHFNLLEGSIYDARNALYEVFTTPFADRSLLVEMESRYARVLRENLGCVSCCMTLIALAIFHRSHKARRPSRIVGCPGGVPGLCDKEFYAVLDKIRESIPPRASPSGFLIKNNLVTTARIKLWCENALSS
jgi:hypothetical protein